MGRFPLVLRGKCGIFAREKKYLSNLELVFIAGTNLSVTLQHIRAIET